MAGYGSCRRDGAHRPAALPRAANRWTLSFMASDATMWNGDGRPMDATVEVAALVGRARAAQAEFETYSQERVDAVVAGVAWAIYRDDRAMALAELSVRDTGLGRVEDKIAKNKRK